MASYDYAVREGCPCDRCVRATKAVEESSLRSNTRRGIQAWLDKAQAEVACEQMDSQVPSSERECLSILADVSVKLGRELDDRFCYTLEHEGGFGVRCPVVVAKNEGSRSVELPRSAFRPLGYPVCVSVSIDADGISFKLTLGSAFREIRLSHGRANDDTAIADMAWRREHQLGTDYGYEALLRVQRLEEQVKRLSDQLDELRRVSFTVGCHSAPIVVQPYGITPCTDRYEEGA